VLSFQEYAKLWWKQRQNDVIRLEILNWSELMTCMRRKFVFPSYLKKEIRGEEEEDRNNKKSRKTPGSLRS